MKNWTHEELLKLDGRRVRCRLSGFRVEDAKIAVEGNTIYLCQNLAEGTFANNTKGYKYTWRISEDPKYEDHNYEVTDIQLLEKTMDDLEVGDILMLKTDNYSKIKILGICGMVYLVSYSYDFEEGAFSYTLKRLKEMFCLETSTPQEEVKEWTMDELAKLAGVDVKDFKIKKE